jgi:hypothetical protein
MGAADLDDVREFFGLFLKGCAQMLEPGQQAVMSPIPNAASDSPFTILLA